MKGQPIPDSVWTLFRPFAPLGLEFHPVISIGQLVSLPVKVQKKLKFFWLYHLLILYHIRALSRAPMIWRNPPVE